ncbi:SDR family NAD(P)-dependent oxidoreductase [candidate division KSB1 bacterium]|nr:SDR family NAD(P)-dependent oxidoreductase [candidate division KSB1 bacterium]
MELENKVALVTGASKGIGRAIALQLARNGVHVALVARNADLLQHVAQQIEALGVRALPIAADIRLESEIVSAVHRTVKTFNRLDILVNNAGIGKFHSIAEMPTQAWDEMFELNMRGLFLMTRECLPHLRRSSESAVINIASLAAKNVFKTGGGYAATKHAVLAFSRCLMLEERQNGVRVLAICPGSVDTDFFDTETSGRAHFMQPQDVADSILTMLHLPQRAMMSEIDIRPSNPAKA